MEMVVKIKQLLLEGVKQREIAKICKISESHLSEIKHTKVRNLP